MSEDDLKFSLCGPLNKKMTKKLHRQCSVLHGRCRWNQKGSKTTKTFKKKREKRRLFRTQTHWGVVCHTQVCVSGGCVSFLFFAPVYTSNRNTFPNLRRNNKTIATDYQNANMNGAMLAVFVFFLLASGKAPIWVSNFSDKTSIEYKLWKEKEREREKKVLKIPSWIDWCHTAASRDIGVGQFVTDVCKCPIEPGAGMVSWSGARRRRRVYNFFWLMRDLVVGSLRKISRQQQWSNLDREVGERETVVKDQLTLATPLQKLGTGRVLLLLDFLSDERIIESFLEPPFR